MKPASEPASSRPKPCASLKKPYESCSFAASSGPRRKKNDNGQKPPGSRFRFSRTGVQPSPGSSTIELPSAFVESGAYPPDRELPGSPRQCSLPLACRHPPEGHQIGARKRRTPENTILSQPYCRRVSTDRPNREGSQLAASLECEPGPTPAGKTLPHSYPETRFRRERARDGCCTDGMFPTHSTIYIIRMPFSYYAVCLVDSSVKCTFGTFSDKGTVRKGE